MVHHVNPGEFPLPLATDPLRQILSTRADVDSKRKRFVFTVGKRPEINEVVSSKSVKTKTSNSKSTQTARKQGQTFIKLFNFHDTTPISIDSDSDVEIVGEKPISPRKSPRNSFTHTQSSTTRQNPAKSRRISAKNGDTVREWTAPSQLPSRAASSSLGRPRAKSVNSLPAKAKSASPVKTPAPEVQLFPYLSDSDFEMDFSAEDSSFDPTEQLHRIEARKESRCLRDKTRAVYDPAIVNARSNDEFLNRPVDTTRLLDSGLFLNYMCDAYRAGKYRGVRIYNDEETHTRLSHPPTVWLRSIAIPTRLEQYQLYEVLPQRDADEYKPIHEIAKVMELVGRFYVPPEYAKQIYDPSMGDCVYRRFKRAALNQSPIDFPAAKKAVDEYNEIILNLQLQGKIWTYLKQKHRRHRIEMTLVENLIDQVYQRTVSPDSKMLNDYVSFSDGTYGELLPPLISKILRRAKINSKSIVLDLGSGVGNFIVQAALQIGCDSYGCELMKKPYNLAMEQRREMMERAKLWGLKLGLIKFYKGDFTEVPEVSELVRKADLILCNNFMFKIELNGKLYDLLSGAKDGCKIVTLRPFSTQRHTLTLDDFRNNRVNALDALIVKKIAFDCDSVSWTGNSGVYYFNTVDRAKAIQELQSGTSRTLKRRLRSHESH